MEFGSHLLDGDFEERKKQNPLFCLREDERKRYLVLIMRACKVPDTENLMRLCEETEDEKYHIAFVKVILDRLIDKMGIRAKAGGPWKETELDRAFRECSARMPNLARRTSYESARNENHWPVVKVCADIYCKRSTDSIVLRQLRALRLGLQDGECRGRAGKSLSKVIACAITFGSVDGTPFQAVSTNEVHRQVIECSLAAGAEIHLNYCSGSFFNATPLFAQWSQPEAETVLPLRSLCNALESKHQPKK